MSNFCEVSYGNNREELGKKNFRALACDDSLSSGNEEDFAILENEKCIKLELSLLAKVMKLFHLETASKRMLVMSSYKGKEITIACHGTRFKHVL